MRSTTMLACFFRSARMRWSVFSRRIPSSSMFRSASSCAFFFFLRRLSDLCSRLARRRSACLARRRSRAPSCWRSDLLVSGAGEARSPAMEATAEVALGLEDAAADVGTLAGLARVLCPATVDLDRGVSCSDE